MSAASPDRPIGDVRYDRVALALHWIMAVLIVVVFGLALTVDVFPRSLKPVIVEAHKDLGVAILLLIALRGAWRLTHRPPEADASMGALMRRAAGLGHLALYALMVAVPLIGIAYTFWRGQGLHLGIIDIASPFEANRPVARQWREVHEFSAYALIGLAGLHAAMALFHHHVLRDGTLRRMLPA
jgi:cytochrome b561